MFWRCYLILIVSCATASYTKIINNKREHISQKEGLQFEDDSLGLAKPSLESPLIDKNTFTENIKVGEKENEFDSLQNLFKLYEKDKAKYEDSLIDLERDKRQYNGQNYGYSNYPKPVMQNNSPAVMPKYFSHRKGKQLAIPEQLSTSGNLYLPNAMPSYFSHRKGKKLMIPQQGPTSGNYYLPAAMPSHFSNRQGKQLAFPEQGLTSGNSYLPNAMTSYFSNRKRKQLIVPQGSTSGNYYLPAPMPNNFSNRKGRQLLIPDPVFSSGNDNFNNPIDYNFQHNIENAYFSPSNHYDYGAKPGETLPLNIPDSQENLDKPKENVLMASQDYQDYYDPRDYREQISNNYYDEYPAYQGYISNYADDKQLDKDLAVENKDNDSQETIKQESSESMDNSTQTDSPLEESNSDDSDSNENENDLLFAEEPKNIKMEKDDENSIEYEYEESKEEIENDEDILLTSDKGDNDSESKSVTQKGGPQVYSIDTEGRIRATGLGEEDVQRLIHQVTDVKEGRNLAFMEKFEGLISRMLN